MFQDAHRKMRVLRTIAWPTEVRDRFFEDGERELPIVSYRPFSAAAAIDLIRSGRALIDGPPAVVQWLKHSASALEHTARMLGSLERQPSLGMRNLYTASPRTRFLARIARHSSLRGD